jgi:hypothetical protein
MCDSPDLPTPRTAVRDAVLADVTATLDADAVDAVEWATTETTDRLSLGTAPGVDLGDFYRGQALREVGL